MVYSSDVISEVKMLNDIVDVVGNYVKLSPRSGNFVGLCPFHNEKSPSFSVNRDRQFFHCFGCGAGGDVIKFVERIENLEFPDALQVLADRAHFILPEKGTSDGKQAAAREIAAKLNTLAARFYHENLFAENAAAENARKYLEERGVKSRLVKRFGLGLAPEGWSGLLKAFPETPPQNFETAGLIKRKESNYYDRFRGRLMFPIIDIRGRVIGFGGRVMAGDDGAKYINSPETALFKKSDCLYGLNLAKKARPPEIIIVEGYMDVLMMHQYGFKNTVGVLGTALKTSHARLIKNTGATTATLILDSDEAGIRAALRAIPVLTGEGLKVKILELPNAKDPDEFLTRFGAENLSNILKRAENHIAFEVNLSRKKHDIATTDGRIGFTKECAKILSTLTSAIDTDAYVNEIAKDTGISPVAIHNEIEKITGQNRTKRDFLPQPRKLPKRGEDIGLKNAKKGLLYLIFTETGAANALNGILSPDEMGGVYGKLLDFALANPQSSHSDVFTFFDGSDEQQALAEIFAESKKYDDKTAAETALTQMTKRIKEAWLLLQLRSAYEKNDINAVNSIHLQIKTVNSLNITLHDG